jgi:hypothetical protein
MAGKKHPNLTVEQRLAMTASARAASPWRDSSYQLFSGSRYAATRTNGSASTEYTIANAKRATARATTLYCKHCGSILSNSTVSTYYLDTCYDCDDIEQSIASARQLLDLEAASYVDYDPSASAYQYSSSRYDYTDNDPEYYYAHGISEGM